MFKKSQIIYKHYHNDYLIRGMHERRFLPVDFNSYKNGEAKITWVVFLHNHSL